LIWGAYVLFIQKKHISKYEKMWTKILRVYLDILCAHGKVSW
jgi:hypothetical protein